MLHTRITLPETKVTLTTYLMEKDEVACSRRRPLVLLCPGGGYSVRVDWEGEPVARKLLGLGLQVVMVNYSVEPAHWPTARNELAEAVAYARSQADEWLCDPNKIAVMGFSAGGHEAAAVGTTWMDSPFGEAARPDAMILGYPVITAGDFRHKNSFIRLLGDDYEKFKEETSLEKRVTPRTPPVFIWTTWEDEIVPTENSLLFVGALRKNGIPCEFHLYQHGKHGLALADGECRASADCTVPALQNWVDMAARWLKEL